MAEQLRGVVVPQHGGPEVLEVREAPVPSPAPGELVVRVAASGVNFIEVYQRIGRYAIDLPFALGGEFAGTVVAVGDGVTDFAVGDVVATAEGRGAHATHAVVAAAKAVAVPDGVDPQLAAAVMLQGMTAHYLVESTYAVQPGDAAVVHAAAGGVGQLLVQLITAKGARVVATVGSSAKADIARALGADTVLRTDELTEPDALAGAVKEAVPGGVHVVYDGVGQATFEASLASLRPRGMLALFGAASGPVPPFDLQRLNAAGSLFVTRPTLGHYLMTREELLWRATDVLDAVGAGRLQVAIGGRYALDDAADAYRDLEGRRSTGKLLLVP